MPRETGPHSKEKLRLVAQYLPPYLQATTRAKERYYIDAFAGPGTNQIKGTSEVIDGSPLVALASEAANGTTFTKYFFIEFDPDVVEELRQVVRQRFPDSRVEIIEGDVNVELPKVVKRLHPRAPTFVLLDTEGIEPAWSTIESISEWKMELLITFPLGMGINRNAAKPKVARYFGGDGWQEIWQSSGPGKVKALLDFYKNRLKELGYIHQSDPPHRIRTENGKDLYYLIHVSKAEPAERIMGWVEDQPDYRGQMKFPETD